MKGTERQRGNISPRESGEGRNQREGKVSAKEQTGRSTNAERENQGEQFSKLTVQQVCHLGMNMMAAIKRSNTACV